MSQIDDAIGLALARYGKKELAMPDYKDDEDAEIYYETVASQEEIYLEETEEEVIEVLIAKDSYQLHKNPLNRSCVGETVEEQRIHAAEELITGDSDDPPLSEGEVANLLGESRDRSEM